MLARLAPSEGSSRTESISRLPRATGGCWQRENCSAYSSFTGSCLHLHAAFSLQTRLSQSIWTAVNKMPQTGGFKTTMYFPQFWSLEV